MNTSGEAADQVVRMSLEVGEAALKISGTGAKHLAVMLYAVLKEKKKTKGRVRLETLVKSGRPLTVFSVKESDLKQFVQEAKRYGVLYCAVRNPRGSSDGLVDVIVKEEEQNFPMVMEMLRAGEVREDDDQYQSPLDELFERLEMKNPEHIAVKYYKDYHSGSAKTLKSIQITLAARLEKFNLSSLAALTATDDLDLPSLGERKVALFALIPDNDTSYNFLVSILYTQLFQQLFYLADHKYGGRLPVHVHFLMDEFANVSLPDDFDKILSVMRSREVSVSIILQNLAQLKALFEKQWESIMGNCDEFLYLGGNEQGTHKYVSELLGKATIDTNTYGKSTGHSGNYSTNYQNTGRELMTPDEVRMLDNRYAILFIRGERPILDEKFDILKHPNVGLTTDGNGKPYLHGAVDRAVASISLGDSLEGEFTDDSLEVEDYELLSDEDLEEIIQKYQ